MCLWLILWVFGREPPTKTPFVCRVRGKSAARNIFRDILIFDGGLYLLVWAWQLGQSAGGDGQPSDVGFVVLLHAHAAAEASGATLAVGRAARESSLPLHAWHRDRRQQTLALAEQQDALRQFLRLKHKRIFLLSIKEFLLFNQKLKARKKLFQFFSYYFQLTQPVIEAQGHMFKIEQKTCQNIKKKSNYLLN